MKASAYNDVVTAIVELQDETTRYFADVERTTSQSISATTWTTVTMTDVTDPLGLYNGTVYTVPASGLYVCVSKLRPNDASPANSIGQGVHTSNIDGAWIAWQDTPQASGQKRLTIVNTRVAEFTAGDQLRLYTFADVAYTINKASMSIYRLST